MNAPLQGTNVKNVRKLKNIIFGGVSRTAHNVNGISKCSVSLLTGCVNGDPLVRLGDSRIKKTSHLETPLNAYRGAKEGGNRGENELRDCNKKRII